MMMQLRTASEGFAFMARDLLRSTFATDLYKSTTITGAGRGYVNDDEDDHDDDEYGSNDDDDTRQGDDGDGLLENQEDLDN